PSPRFRRRLCSANLTQPASHDNLPAMVSPDSSDQSLLLDNRVTSAIVRYRKYLFLLVALLYVISFNGRWRLGLDTANYRGLAINLVRGKGYTFGDWAPHQIYPGLPYLLAG